LTSRRIDQIPASKGVTTADQIAVWQDGRTRVGTIGDLIEGPIYDVVEGITGVRPDDPLGLTALKRANNLSDLPNPAIARGNLGLGFAAQLGAGVSGGVALFDDPRFNNLAPKIYAASILDSSVSGRAILTGLPDAARVALGLGTAATKDVGVSGGVAAYDDPRFSNSGGGGGAPSTVTASQISDSTATGRSVITGTEAQGRTALGVAPLFDAIKISASPTPVWAAHTAIFDREFVGVGLATSPTNGAPGGGYADKQAWPGGGLYGSTSAVTGYVRVPPEAEASFANGNPTNFFHAGVMGLTLNDTNNQATVGVFGMARAGKTQGRPFGANFVIANVRDSAGIYDATNNRIPGVHFQGVGIEVDCTWSQPAGSPTGGSNLLGIWIPAECYGGRPDGDCAAIKTGLYSDKPGDSCWKQFLLADHGAADLFAQVGMKKNKLIAGASESQGFFLISARDGQYNVNPQTGAFISDTHQYKFSKIYQSPDGDIVFKPNSGFGSIIVSNESDTQKSLVSPTSISSPSGTFGNLSVPNSATISGAVTAGSVSTGALNSSSFNTTGAAGVGGNLTVGGNVASATSATGDATINGTMFYKGQPVQLSASGGTIPPGFKALMIAG